MYVLIATMMGILRNLNNLKKEHLTIMTQEEIQLLLVDLSARLPYGVICKVKYILNNETTYGEDIEKECTDIVKRIYFDNYTVYTEWLGQECDVEDIKPYLRSMSSMTEEEKEELYQKTGFKIDDYFLGLSAIDWLNAHHFDYRGLIERDLAIAVTKENPYERK